MDEAHPEARALKPRLDGRRVLFEIVEDGRSVACAISLNALQDLSGERYLKPADSIRSFAAAEARIAAAAVGKHRARSGNPSGLLNLWTDDFDDPLGDDVPAAGRTPAG